MAIWMMKVGAACAAVLFSLSLAAFAQDPAASVQGAESVTGVAMYRERIAMPKNAVFEATLSDVSKMDAPAEVIGKAVMENPGNPPYHFSITYDPRRIVDNHTYAVRATIKIDDQLALTSDTSYPVITRGSGKDVNILMRSVRSGTAASESGGSPGRAKLENTNWRLTRVGDKDVAASQNQRAPYFVLDPGDHRVAGSGGCNRITGTYKIEKDAIHFGPVASTMMACPSGMDTEKDFLQALDAAHKWKIESDELELYGEDGKTLARFEVSEAQ